MPAFDPAKVLSSDPHVRLANSYQAVLDFMANRLSTANNTAFLADLVSAGLPDDSDDVLNFAEPGRIVEACQAIAFSYLAQYPINPSTVASFPLSLASLTVGDFLTVVGALNVTGAAFYGGNLTVAGNFAILLGTLTVADDMAVAGDVLLDPGASIRIGGASLPTISDGLAAAGPLQGSHIRFTGRQTAALMGAGDLYEDENGDLIYQTIESPSRKVPITRPTHDTGWIGVASIPSPAALPDIYADSGLMQVQAMPGDPGGPTRIAVWLKVDKSLVDGLSPASNEYYYYLVGAATSSTNKFTGIEVQIDGSTGEVTVLLPEAGDPILPITDVDIDADPEPEFRVMIWTR